MKLGLLALLLLAMGCSEPGVTDISADELLARTTGDALILDVRSAEEFASGHVPGAVNIPHTELGARLDELGNDRAKPVVVYCERGRRAGTAADVLLEGGFGNVLHLAGDMSQWRSEGRPTVAPPPVVDVAVLRDQASAIFGALPDVARSDSNAVSPEKVRLGRMLYFERRLSKNQETSCNSCHPLADFGQDGEPTSPGHRGQRGARNSPTVYNAALHVAQFWDGRAPDVEAQAKGPILNPVEMAMPNEDAVLELLRSIPGYVTEFAAAFPADADPISYNNLALAIGAFERRLLTPGRFDAFVSGQDDAVDAAELAGLQTFIETGCVSCHSGPAIGGGMFQKLGLVKPYDTDDQGRFEITGLESDRGVFKVPSLRNVAETAPYFHDGSIASLDQAVSLMAEHQLGRVLTPEQNASIRRFLSALTGDVDGSYVADPTLPESGPTTPAPDPT